MSAVGSNSDGSRLIVAGSLPASGMSIASAEPPSLPCAGRRARRTDHPSPHTVVAGARSPARRPPVSHLPCTHSFRTNGGHTDARIHRLSTAGAGCIGVSGTASGTPIATASAVAWRGRPRAAPAAISRAVFAIACSPSIRWPLAPFQFLTGSEPPRHLPRVTRPRRPRRCGLGS